MTKAKNATLVATQKQIETAQKRAIVIGNSYIKADAKLRVRASITAATAIIKLVPVFEGLSATACDTIRREYKQLFVTKKTPNPKTPQRHCAIALGIVKGNLDNFDPKNPPSMGSLFSQVKANGDKKTAPKPGGITAGGKSQGKAEPGTVPGKGTPSAYVVDAVEVREAIRALVELSRNEEISKPQWQQVRRLITTVSAAVQPPK